VLVSGAGDNPREVLNQQGIAVVEMSGFIEMGLQAIYANSDPSIFKGRRNGCAKGACTGDRSGCM